MGFVFFFFFLFVLLYTFSFLFSSALRALMGSSPSLSSHSPPVAEKLGRIPAILNNSNISVDSSLLSAWPFLSKQVSCVEPFLLLAAVV